MRASCLTVSIDGGSHAKCLSRMLRRSQRQAAAQDVQKDVRLRRPATIFRIPVRTVADRKTVDEGVRKKLLEDINEIKKKDTLVLVDGILKLLVGGSALTAVLIAPNITQVLDKPLERFSRKMDKRQREREIQKALYYMKEHHLVSGSYDHGLKITPNGKKRLAKANLDYLKIPQPKKWDKKWRLVIFDIPEKYKTGRDALTCKLKDLGFFPLQRSALVYPYPCRKEIEVITAAFGINQYVSYIETNHIDQQKHLIKRFNKLKIH